MTFKLLSSLVNRKIGYGIVQPGESVPNGVPVIKVNNVLQGLKSVDSLDTTKTENAEKYSRTKLSGGELIVSVVGTVGKTAIVPHKFAGCNLVRATALIDIPDETTTLWVKYYIDSPIGQLYINTNLNTTVQPTFNIKSLESMPIPFYEDDYIERAVSILSRIDEKIKLNNAINENLEQQAQAIFKSWFVDFEPFGGVMPYDWKTGTIADLGTVVGGGTPSKKVEEYYTTNGIAWITPKDLSNDKSKFISHGETDISDLGLAKSSATLMPKGTVLFSSRAPIGYIAIANGQVSTNQGFKSVVPFENIGTAYVYYFLKNNLSAIENVASGSTFKEVSGSTMKNFCAVIPDSDTLAVFRQFCEPLFEQQKALEHENRYLATLRDTLLPKLMNGEIDVSEVKI